MEKPVLNKNAVITSGYGYRVINGKREFHGGIDIAVPGGLRNVPVYATCAGIVSALITEKSISCGLSVFVKPTGLDFYCLYFHLDYINADLSVGENILVGQYLGGMGDTGRSFGVHLHYGHRKGMASGTETIEPSKIISLYEKK